MQAFKTHRGKVAVIDRSNIDTDAIIPKQFLKSIRRSGFEKGLFFDWRFLPDGRPNPDFILNQPAYSKASILVARNNFGCGSSREHAVWALTQYGFRVILAPRQGDIPAFADIFHNNSVKNGLLNVQLSDEEIRKIIALQTSHPDLEMTVDLPSQKLTLHTPTEVEFSFEIDAAEKNHLIRGLDDIGLSLEFADAITAFEKNHDTGIRQDGGCGGAAK